MNECARVLEQLVSVGPKVVALSLGNLIRCLIEEYEILNPEQIIDNSRLLGSWSRIAKAATRIAAVIAITARHCHLVVTA